MPWHFLVEDVNLPSRDLTYKMMFRFPRWDTGYVSWRVSQASSFQSASLQMMISSPQRRRLRWLSPAMAEFVSSRGSQAGETSMLSHRVTFGL